MQHQVHVQRSSREVLGWTLITVVVAIGCGSGLPAPSDARQAGTPQDAAATTDATPSSDQRPIQLAQAPAGSQPSASGTASITGTVKFAGSQPPAERVKMDADPQCLLQHKEPVHKQEIVVNPNGTLRHVFVYVKQGLEGRTFPTPTSPVVLDQHGCLYNPHVFGMQVSQPLEIVNSDPTLHNVNCKATKSKPFNIAQPTKGMKSTKTFAAPEIMVKCACNVHPWMATYIGVLSHPFFGVTGEDGRVTLSGLPAGQYTLEAWHEKCGTQTQTVTVGDGDTKQLNFEFTVP